MAEYVLLDGVRTGYEQHGDGDPLVLLHPGGAGSTRERLGRTSRHWPRSSPSTRRSGVRTAARMTWRDRSPSMRWHRT
jgi:hypothetical protein